MAEAIDQNREIKQRAIRRLSVAVVLVVAAVGILTYLSYYKPPKSTPKPIAETLPPPPPPIVTGPEPQAVQPATPAEPPLPAPDALPPAPATAATPPLPAPAPAIAPPPPPAVVSKPLAKPGPGPKKDSEQVKPLVKEQPNPAPQPAPTTQATPATPTPAPVAAPTPPKPAPNGYIVQFGVFSSMQNAAQLVERLKQLGIDAQTETKVHLPAFKTKAEADAAMAKMKEKGISAVVVGK